ncbi:MAG: hypothetical protein IT168_06540 [Bryobacterales bacterium]|nr:hypothetical protein [Bryobacterales bacterium]
MTNAAIYCRNCGKPLTDEDKATPGRILCSVCAPAPSAAAGPAATATVTEPSPYTAAPGMRVEPVSDGVSPGLAFMLGLIPGVGAIYNAQYVKGLVHVFVFGVLLALANSAGHSQPELEPLLVMLVMAWIPYMAFEAYHTAKRRKYGIRVDEFSSVFPLRGGNVAGPAALIGVGLIALLNNLEILRISQLLRYWPLGLIGLGVYMLYVRLSDSAVVPPAVEEVSHDSH